MRKSTRVLTPLERRIMRVLRGSGPGNVQKVLQGLTGKPQLAYTTGQTTLNFLQHKGKVKRKLVGRAHESSATVSQESADFHALKDVLQKVFPRIGRRSFAVSGSEQEARRARTRAIAGETASLRE